MCYLLRQQQAEVQAVDPIATPGKPTVRPRWAGAALMLIGGLAVAAALVDSQPQPGSVAVQQVAAPVPTSTTAAAVTAGSGATQVSLPADDGVPSSTGILKAGAGSCHHGM